MSKNLVDTHTFLWLATDDSMLSRRVVELFADPAEELFLSAASIWEIAIKVSIGKLALRTTLEQLVRGGVERGIRLLDVTSHHAFIVERLPFHHRDPFDRMLVAQASQEAMQIVSRDESFDCYSVTRVW